MMSNYGYKKKKSVPVIFEPPCILHPISEVNIFTILKTLLVHFSGGDEEDKENVSHISLCPVRVSNRQLTINSERRSCFGQLAG